MSETARAVSITFDLTGSLIFAAAALSASRLSRRGLWPGPHAFAVHGHPLITRDGRVHRIPIQRP
jgi:hypothetical protein